MRVAHIITRMIVGGAQENTLFNCQDLVRNYGDDVQLLTGPSTGPEGCLLQYAREQGGAGDFDITEIPSLRRAINPVHDLRALRSLKSKLRDFRPDVVHTHSAKGGILGRVAAWQLDVPAVIHTIHGAPFHPYQNSVTRTAYRLCERFAARRCHKIISVADAMTDLVVQAGVTERSKCETVYSGMDVEQFVSAQLLRDEMRRELGYSADDIVVGKIARLFPLKGHELVIQAARKAIASAPNLKFLFIGDGILRQKLKHQVQRAGIGSNVRFRGLVAPAEVPKQLAAMDVLVHASLREGLARTLPQAMLAGVTPVSFDIDGAREVVEDRVTGRLLPPRDVEGMADALIELAARSDLRRQWAGEGGRRCEKLFDHERMTARIRKIYEQVLDGR